MKYATLSILLIFLSTMGMAQSFKTLKIEADSLTRKLSYEHALEVYTKAIDLALGDKEKISDEELLPVLYSAAEAATQLEGKTQHFNPLAKKYWGMIRGSKGEKMEEKITFLKDLGIKDLIVYYPHGGMTSSYVIRGCSSNITKYLIWLQGTKTYIQQFDECNSYKPVLIPNSPINQYFSNYKQLIATEKLLRVKRISDMGVYDLTFIDGKGVYYQTTYHDFDLSDPDPDKKKQPIEEVNIPILDYKRNMETKLSKLIPMIGDGISQYRAAITSGKERTMIGKF